MSNGYVKNTELDKKLDEIIKGLNEQRIMIEVLSGDMKVTRVYVEKNSEVLNKHDSKIDALELSDKKWGGISMVIAAVISGIGALLGIKN